jgi:hypothetical protein
MLLSLSYALAAKGGCGEKKWSFVPSWDRPVKRDAALLVPERRVNGVTATSTSGGKTVTGEKKLRTGCSLQAWDPPPDDEQSGTNVSSTDDSLCKTASTSTAAPRAPQYGSLVAFELEPLLQGA